MQDRLDAGRIIPREYSHLLANTVRIQRQLASVITLAVALGFMAGPCFASLLSLPENDVQELTDGSGEQEPAPQKTPRRPVVLQQQSALGNSISGSSLAPVSSVNSVLACDTHFDLQMAAVDKVYLSCWLTLPLPLVADLLRPPQTI